MMSYSLVVKCILIGDTQVGKSCLLRQFTYHKFKEKHEATIGVEFEARLVKIDEIFVQLQMWDTAGQKSYWSISRGYFRNSAVAFVVFDATNRNSFESLSMWINEVKERVPQDIIFLVVANKVDLVEERCVSTDEGLNFANQNSIFYAETSAIDKNSVEKVFELVTRIVCTKVKDGIIDHKDQRSGVKKGNF